MTVRLLSDRDRSLTHRERQIAYWHGHDRLPVTDCFLTEHDRLHTQGSDTLRMYLEIIADRLVTLVIDECPLPMVMTDRSLHAHDRMLPHRSREVAYL